MTTLSDLFAANGQDDEQEPWTAGDDCEMIEFLGEDLVVLAADGVARWTNHRREWAEVDESSADCTAEEIFRSGMGGNSGEAITFLEWVARFYDVPDDLLARYAARECGALDGNGIEECF